MNVRKEIGPTLKRNRLEKGHSIASASLSTGISEDMMYRIEAGMTCKIEKVALLAELYEKPVWEIVYEAEIGND